jgi:sugar lactone lactonase YvrE
VTIDADGNAWVQAFGSLVSVFDPDGNFIKSLGVNGEFFNPSSVAFDSQGNIYIADGSMPFPFPNGNHRIEIYSSSEEYINTIGVTGESGSDNQHFSNPHLIAIDSLDRLYVADSFNHRVQIFDISEPLSPTYAATLGITGECDQCNHLCKPMGVADDSLLCGRYREWRCRFSISIFAVTPPPVTARIQAVPRSPSFAAISYHRRCGRESSVRQQPNFVRPRTTNVPT